MEINLPNVQYILGTLVGCLVTLAAEGHLLLKDQNYEPLRKIKDRESIQLHLVENASGKSARAL